MTEASAASESPGEGAARTRDIVLVFALLLIITAVLVVVLVQAWPAGPQTGPDGRTEVTPSAKTVHFPGWTTTMSRETSLFVIVMAAGALGGIAHVLRSFYWYAGNRALRRSWLLMYLLLPIVGALFGLIVYLVVRGGLTSPFGGAGDINPYGIAAIAALVGQFSRETAEKFRDVFSTLLAPAPQGRDHAFTPAVTAIEPLSGPPGTRVTIAGSGLGSATFVRFGTGRAPATDVTDTRVETIVPDGAASGPLIVVTPTGAAASSETFTVEPAPG
ncbi:IPT/TIG domain-containing protein [Actinomadura meyerae]|uniref:IPT/TIG domain-containing protein n=1 Tax=Actinomadura meyerae TaxID=240840 RepID=A0A239NY32_9ACTN|nr:IPT/TIG domain-containing protein [Actinomadura meyerae]SNT59264.1 IPT/TIG domain-containing protein [Actinomadura meyerae]